MNKDSGKLSSLSLCLWKLNFYFLACRSGTQCGLFVFVAHPPQDSIYCVSFSPHRKSKGRLYEFILPGILNHSAHFLLTSVMKNLFPPTEWWYCLFFPPFCVNWRLFVLNSQAISRLWRAYLANTDIPKNHSHDFMQFVLTIRFCLFISI